MNVPNTRLFWHYTFPLVTGAGFIVALFACADALSAPEGLRLITVQVFSWLLMAIFIGYILDPEQPLEPMMTAGALLVLIALTMILPSVAAGIASWFLFAAIAFFCFKLSDDESSVETLSRALLYFWTVSSALLMLADLPMLRFSRPLLPSSDLWRLLLDLRAIGTAAVLLVLLSKAAVAAEELPAPDIPPLPQVPWEPIPEDPDSVLNAILRPISLVVTGVLAGLRAGLNVLWIFFAQVGAFLARLMSALQQLFTRLLLNQQDLANIIRLVGGMVCLIFVVRISIGSSNGVVGYLRSVPQPDALNLFHMTVLALFYLTGNLVLVYLMESYTLLDEDAFHECTTKGAFVGTVLLLSLAGSGLLAYLAAQMPLFRFTGFSRPGNFTLFMLLVCVGMLGLLAWRGQPKPMSAVRNDPLPVWGRLGQEPSGLDAAEATLGPRSSDATAYTSSAPESGPGPGRGPEPRLKP